MRIAAVVLAAGMSSRMGRAKALLEYAGETFVARLARLAREAGLEPLVIVAGAAAGAIEKAHPEFRNLVVLNRNPELGQLHSLKLAIESLPPSVDGAVMFLVDHPAVAGSTVCALVEARERTGSPIVVPRFAARRGHPVLFGREVFEELLSAPLSEGARLVVRRHAAEVAEVEVEDRGILGDIDTPDQYEELRKNE